MARVLTESVKKNQRSLLKIGASFQDAVKALLQTPPPPDPLKGSRAKAKKKTARKAKKR